MTIKILHARQPIPRSLVDRLHRVRLDLDMSYDVMAASVRVSRPQLYRLMAYPKSRTTDRTIAKIERWLEKHERAQAVSA